MATLKQCKENDRITNIAISKIEKHLNCYNGKWNNMKKEYQFEYGEKLNSRYLYLSQEALFHIESYVDSLNNNNK